MTLPVTAKRRGPTLGSSAPAQAAEVPSERIVRLKAQAVSVNDQPNCRTKIVWKKLHAYTVPKQTCRTVQNSAMIERGISSLCCAIFLDLNRQSLASSDLTPPLR